MRTVEEIKADIASCDSSWIDSALCRSLRCELYETILDGIPLDRLEAICAAEKDGRCVVLPCNVGDTVYEVAKGLSIYKSGLHPYVHEHIATELNVFDWERQKDFGKTVFLTRAEAEKALEKEQGQ